MHPLYQTFNESFQCHNAQGLSFMMHLHRQAELVLALEGEIELNIDGHQSVLSAGDLAVVFPDVPHSYKSRGSSRSVLLIFDPELAGGTIPLFCEWQPNNPIFPAANLHADIPYVFHSLLKTDFNKQGGKALMRGYILIIMGHLSGMWQAERTINPMGDRLRDLLHYLNQNFTQPISLDLLSQELGTSKFHLSRLFSKKIGCGLNDYLNALRFRYACELLESTTRYVTEIAYAAGFESQSTFYRFFKEQTNSTPTEYRNAVHGLTA